MFHTSNPSNYPAKWDEDYVKDYGWSDWADDGYCGECGTDDPETPASHHPDCTVGDDVLHDTLAELQDDDR